MPHPRDLSSNHLHSRNSEHPVTYVLTGESAPDPPTQAPLGALLGRIRRAGRRSKLFRLWTTQRSVGM